MTVLVLFKTAMGQPSGMLADCCGAFLVEVVKVPVETPGKRKGSGLGYSQDATGASASNASLMLWCLVFPGLGPVVSDLAVTHRTSSSTVAPWSSQDGHGVKTSECFVKLHFPAWNATFQSHTAKLSPGGVAPNSNTTLTSEAEAVYSGSGSSSPTNASVTAELVMGAAEESENPSASSYPAALQTIINPLGPWSAIALPARPTAKPEAASEQLPEAAHAAAGQMPQARKAGSPTGGSVARQGGGVLLYFNLPAVAVQAVLSSPVLSALVPNAKLN
eukprot:gene24749-10388_t